MEMKDDDFRTLQNKVDQISSELDKQNTVRVVNTKWMIIVGAVILSALGFTSFVQLPREANRAAKEQVGPDIKKKAEEIVLDLQSILTDAQGIKKDLGEISELQKIANLPIGSIIPSMLDSRLFAEAVGDDPNHFDPKNSNWALADGREIPGSRYNTDYGGQKNVPDLRGLFLRGLNGDRSDEKKDPDGNERFPGDYQKDSYAAHLHSIPVSQNSGKIWGFNYGGQGNFGGPGQKHYRTTSETGVKETRPKNAAVYYYIKIN